MVAVGADGELDRLPLLQLDAMRRPPFRGDRHRGPFADIGRLESAGLIGQPGLELRLLPRRASGRDRRITLGNGGLPGGECCLGLSRREERHHVARLPLRLTSWEGKLRAIEDPVEGVVIFRGNRIVFVVVAAGTAGGQPEEIFAEIVDQVFVHQMHVLIDVVAEAPRDGEVAGGNQSLAAGWIVGPRPEDVAGDLEAENLAPGKIAIEGVVNPVAVAPGMREGAVGVLAGGVGVADDIEPVAAPLHTVLRALQQSIDDRPERLPIGRRIGEKGIDFLGRGREAGEIVGGAAKERAPIGRGGRSDAGGIEARLEEAV